MDWIGLGLLNRCSREHSHAGESAQPHRLYSQNRHKKCFECRVNHSTCLLTPVKFL